MKELSIDTVNRWGALGAAAILIAAVPTFVIDSDSWAESVFICGAAVMATVMAAATQWSQAAMRPRRREQCLTVFVWPALVLLVNSAVAIGGSGHVLFAISAGFLAFLYLGVCAGVTQYPLRRILWLVPAGLAGPALSGDLITRHDIVPLLSVAVAWTAAAQLPAGLLRTLDHHNRHLAQLANTDPLTGLRNRRALARDLQMAAAPVRPNGRRHGRAGRPFDDRPTGDQVCASVGDDRGAIAILDLDDFKHFNDAHGHLAGDALLADFAAFLDAATRHTDLVYRFGGEEFLILLPSTPQELATTVIEELTNAWQCRDGRVTFSAGIATLTADPACLEAADANLYLAKRAGRNLVIAESPKPAPPRHPSQQGPVEHCGGERGPVERAGTGSLEDTHRGTDRHDPVDVTTTTLLVRD